VITVPAKPRVKVTLIDEVTVAITCGTKFEKWIQANNEPEAIEVKVILRDLFASVAAQE
jgi:hypothetical protein